MASPTRLRLARHRRPRPRRALTGGHWLSDRNENAALHPSARRTDSRRSTLAGAAPRTLPGRRAAGHLHRPCPRSRNGTRRSTDRLARPARAGTTRGMLIKIPTARVKSQRQPGRARTRPPAATTAACRITGSRARCVRAGESCATPRGVVVSSAVTSPAAVVASNPERRAEPRALGEHAGQRGAEHHADGRAGHGRPNARLAAATRCLSERAVRGRVPERAAADAHRPRDDHVPRSRWPHHSPGVA